MLPGRRRDAAVQRHRHLHQHQRALALDPARKSFIQPSRFRLAHPHNRFQPRRAQALHAMPGNVGIGIARCRHHALQSCRDQRLRAWPGASRVVAGLQRHVGSAAAQPVARMLLRLIQRNNFRMIQQVVLVPALADHLPRAIQNHAPHGRVRRADTAIPRRASSSARCIQ